MMKIFLFFKNKFFFVSSSLFNQRLCSIIIETEFLWSFFTFLSYEKLLVACEKSFLKFSSIRDVLRPPEWENNGFYDNFRKNYWIGLCFGTLLEGTKSKNELVNQSFFTNGSVFLHKKHFSKNHKFIFPAKMYEIRKTC